MWKDTDWIKQRRRVDVQRLIQENSGDVLKAIASAKITGLDLDLPASAEAEKTNYFRKKSNFIR